MKNLLYISFLLVAVLSFGQERTISGNVISEEDGLPLPGATVMVKNTTRGISTDLDGNYSLKNVIPNDTLVFSFMGYKTQKIRADRDTINVQMRDDGIIIETVYGPAYYLPLPVYSQAIRITGKDLRNRNNPKYNFDKASKSDVFIIYISELFDDNYNKEELEFQEKYNVKYSLSGGHSVRYFKKFNKLTFKHLNKKYNKTWQTEIRKDAIGLDDFTGK